jgi:hypothetical protein
VWVCRGVAGRSEAAIETVWHMMWSGCG